MWPSVLDLLDLQIRDRGLEMRVPVDQPLAAIDVALVVEIDEHADHRVVEIALSPGGQFGAPDMVKALRDQSQEAPSRLSWLMIVPPDCAFHSQTLATNSSRVKSVRRFCLLGQFALHHHLRGDAGMVLPGCHSVSKPRIRCQRTRMSCSVLLKACPMCSEPVTLGGGIMMQKVSLREALAGRRWPRPNDAGLGLGGVEGLVPMAGSPFRARDRGV
jgi:hypothetical protein